MQFLTAKYLQRHRIPKYILKYAPQFCSQTHNYMNIRQRYLSDFCCPLTQSQLHHKEIAPTFVICPLLWKERVVKSSMEKDKDDQWRHWGIESHNMYFLWPGSMFGPFIVWLYGPVWEPVTVASPKKYSSSICCQNLESETHRVQSWGQRWLTGRTLQRTEWWTAIWVEMISLVIVKKYFSAWWKIFG